MSIGRAYYKASVNKFLETSPEHIAGVIQAQHVQDIVHQQSSAWRSQIHLLQKQLTFIDDGQIFFEFVIPRMGKRADIVLLTGGIVFIIEFKVGESLFHQRDIRQVHDYALDLKNFHAGSHLLPIVPVLIATHAPTHEILLRDAWDGVIDPILSNGENLGVLIEYVVAKLTTTNEIPDLGVCLVQANTDDRPSRASSLCQPHRGGHCSK